MLSVSTAVGVSVDVSASRNPTGFEQLYTYASAMLKQPSHRAQLDKTVAADVTSLHAVSAEDMIVTITPDTHFPNRSTLPSKLVPSVQIPTYLERSWKNKNTYTRKHTQHNTPLSRAKKKKQ